MNEKNALKIRKVLPKKYVNKVELVIVEYGTIVERFEAGLMSEEQAQKKMTSLFKEAIQNNVIAPSSVPEIMSVDRETIEYLKNKHGV